MYIFHQSIIINKICIIGLNKEINLLVYNPLKKMKFNRFTMTMIDAFRSIIAMIDTYTYKNLLLIKSRIR